MALGRAERAVMGGVGWAPHTRTCLHLHVASSGLGVGTRGHWSQLNTVPSPPTQSKELGHQRHCHPGLNPGGGVGREQLCGFQSPPITSDTWTQQAQRAGTSPCAPRQGTSKLEPSASCPPGPPNMPTSAPKVHFPHGGPLTLSTPCPGLTPGPGVGPGSLWSQSCGISTHPGRLGLHPARQQQQQKQQQGQPRWGAGAGDPSPAPHGSSWAGVRSGGTREQGEGQGCRQMINPGCLPCWEVRMSAISAAQLTLPGPAVPSRLRHALPGPDRVLQAPHRRLLQEVFQDDVEGRGLEPPVPASGPHPARGLATVYL